MDLRFIPVDSVEHTSQAMTILYQKVFMGDMVRRSLDYYLWHVSIVHLNSSDTISFAAITVVNQSGRAYLFDQCVNVDVGPAEDRRLITGMHSVCDIYCKRCKTTVGWTYAKAYEFSQKYKEGKFIIEKINLHMEESDYYNVSHPAGERRDRWRLRSMSWGSDNSLTASPRARSDGSIVYEYEPSVQSGNLSPYLRPRSLSKGSNNLDSPSNPNMERARIPAPPDL